MTSNSPLTFEQYLKRQQHHFEKVYRTLLAELLANCPAPHLAESMQYSALGGGKHVRPVLVYSAAEAVGATSDHQLVLDYTAAAVESLHTYSLIHDDLPAMDDDNLRRGKPTCHIQFDEATAILAGDALQTCAFELLTQAPATDTTRLQLVKQLANASGVEGMVAGQAIDLNAVNQTLTLAQLERMHRAKTGALIEASVAMGATATGLASTKQLRQLEQYAQAIGLAFQVQDDILDVISDTQILGKTQGADAQHNKPTYVSLLGLEGAKAKANGLHKTALAALSAFDARADRLRQLSAYIIQRLH